MDAAGRGGGGLLQAASSEAPAAIGKYRVDNIIGQGAVGIVYKCFDPNICRFVAIKTLRREVLASVDDPEGLLQRFASEARSAGNCQHPNIVTVYDYIEQDSAPHIVMEYVAAGTLENVTRPRMRLPLHQVVEIMVQLLAALDHAHSKGVIHRDIKPANILCPAATSIKVADFGVARIHDLNLSRDGGGGVGTPNYMSPEQFLARDVDARTDLFAVGVILFQLLTGQKPFAATDLIELMHKVLYESPPSLRTMRPELSGPLDEVVQKSLARNPADRFQTAEAFASALIAALENSSEYDANRAIDLTRLPPPLPGDKAEPSRGSLSRTMAERLSPETLSYIEEQFVRAIGPVAPLVLSRATRETTDAENLLTRLTSHIPRPSEAAAFRKAAENSLREDRGIAHAQLQAVITDDEIRKATALLLPLIGPVAKVLAEREAKTAIGREDYYEHLARAIDNEKDRAQFLKRQIPRATERG